MRLWSDRIPSILRKWRLIPSLIEEGVVEAEQGEEDTVPDTVLEIEEIVSEGEIESDLEEDTASETETDSEDSQTDSEEDRDSWNETVSWPETEDELDWEGL